MTSWASAGAATSNITPPLGSLIGFAWGFADGLIGGALLALIYNFLAAKLARQKPVAAPQS